MIIIMRKEDNNALYVREERERARYDEKHELVGSEMNEDGGAFLSGLVFTGYHINREQCLIHYDTKKTTSECKET